MTAPTAEQKAATAGIFKNIKTLLEKGLFFGEYGGLVGEAIGFLNANIAAIETDLKPAEVPAPKRTKIKGATA